MYEKILVPLDGSALAEVALPYAELLSGKLGSEVTLIYIHEATEVSNQHMGQFYLERMVEVTKQGAERGRRPSGDPGIKVNSAVQVGNPAEEIIGYAGKENVDLILMAAHGQSGIKNWALGNVAEKVVRATDRPVMLIRANGARTEKVNIGSVLLPLDGSKEGEAALPYIEQLASKLGARVILLQVLATGYIGLGYTYVAYTEQQIVSDSALAKDYLDKVSGRLRQSGIATESVVRLGNAAEEIIEFTDKVGTDLVAMSTHGRSGIGHWVFGSVAERVLHSANKPLLLVRAQKASTK